MSFSRELERIHERISIRDADREPYVEMFNTIRTWLMRKMCAADTLFKEMFKGTTLFGSYPNRVRIIKPSEFDVFILLDLPFPFKVCPHPDRPGFVEITGKQWKNLKNSEFKDEFREMFYERKVLQKAWLNRNKFQAWIEDIVEFVLSEESLPYPYKLLNYQLCDVAHTFKVQDTTKPSRKISIDFVPSIILYKEDVQSLVNRKNRKIFKQEYFDSFVAIPKRLNGCGPRTSRRYSFQLVNPVAERDIIWNHQNLKIVYRLLKSLRNNYNLRRVKSYFLTAIFLHEVENNDDDFWFQPIGDIFMHMLSVLIDYFESENLPFYWAPRFNLLSILRPEESDKYHAILVNAHNRLLKLSLNKSVSYIVADHFKTRREEDD